MLRGFQHGHSTPRFARFRNVISRSSLRRLAGSQSIFSLRNFNPPPPVFLPPCNLEKSTARRPQERQSGTGPACAIPLDRAPANHLLGVVHQVVGTSTYPRGMVPNPREDGASPDELGRHPRVKQNPDPARAVPPLPTAAVNQAAAVRRRTPRVRRQVRVPSKRPSPALRGTRIDLGVAVRAVRRAIHEATPLPSSCPSMNCRKGTKSEPQQNGERAQFVWACVPETLCPRREVAAARQCPSCTSIEWAM